jgi:hypothetical protein
MKRKNYQTRENGSIVYLAVLGFAILFMFLAFLNQMLVKNRKDIDLRVKLDGLALNISEAGLFETLAQFRKKGTMSHKRNPQRDGSGNVVVNGSGEIQYLNEENNVDFNFSWTCRNADIGCTNVLDEPFHFELAYKSLFEDHSNDVCDDCTAAGRSQEGFYVLESEEPQIGVVRNFDVLGKTAEIDPITHEKLNDYGNLKVRYEVWERMVEDFSKETGYDSSDSGRVWAAKSVGIVYKVNLVAGVEEMETLATVLQTRMYKKPTINFPDKSALYNTNPDGFISLNATAQIINNGDKNTIRSGLWGKQDNIGAAHGGGNVIDFGFGGASAQSLAPMDFQTCFGMDESQMKEFADTYISDLTDPRLYTPLMDSEIRYVVGNVVYSTLKPLFGNGLLIVDGNITLGGIGHKFDGIVWSTKDVTIQAGGYIKGCVVAGSKDLSAKATLFLKGDNASNWFYVYFDPEAIAAINDKKFKYTMFRVPYVKKGAASIDLSDEEKELRKELIFAKYK